MSYITMTSLADAISTLPRPYPPVRLIKHYKGATLKQQGRIIDINPVCATVQATQRLTFHILLGMIHLRSGTFPGAISATIQPIDYTQGIFQLSDLSYGDWMDRKGERVQPKSPTYVTMGYYRKTYRALLEDISSEGMGILANRTIDPEGRLQPGAKLLFKFQLAPASMLIQLKGSVVYRKDIGQQLIRFGMQLFPQIAPHKTLQSYVIQRHDEILHELEQDYIQRCEAYRVENQYF